MSNADRFPCGDEIEEPTSTMSTTNDEQAKYGTERAPMLSDEELGQMLAHEMSCDHPHLVRIFYESLITKGVLRVAKKVELVPGWDGALSCPCGYPHFEGRDENFCPGCGAMIEK